MKLRHINCSGPVFLRHTDTLYITLNNAALFSQTTSYL